jgi:hypothetical protein
VEELISFLANNFHFVIIAIGIIYSLFFRKSQQEQRRPNRMPDFGGGNQRTKQPDREESRVPAPRREQTIRVESRRPEPLSVTIGESIDAEDAYAIDEPAVRPESSARTNPIDASLAGNTGNSDSSRGLAGSDLTRAVMWAEILGPPRARKPFRR